MSTLSEVPIIFKCQNETLLGIVHTANSSSEIGVVIVVGGPQYRVGSHRQFLLLARYLASNGLPVMRFDYRGMGDSSGALRTFEDVTVDIKSAIDVFMHEIPRLKRIVIWGLCDAASAALFYAHMDKRVSGLILLNPWVRTEAGEAKAYLKHYYLSRLFRKDFWFKVLKGQFRPGESLKSITDFSKAAKGDTKGHASCGVAPLPERMLDGLHKYSGRILFVLSGDDLTAAEFRDLINSSNDWKKALKAGGVELKEVEDANHTFSSAQWRGQVERMCVDWIRASLTGL